MGSNPVAPTKDFIIKHNINLNNRCVCFKINKTDYFANLTSNSREIITRFLFIYDTNKIGYLHRHPTSNVFNQSPFI